MGRPIIKRRASFPETYFSFRTRPQATEPQARVSPSSKLVVMAQYLWPSISDNVSVNVSKLLANSPNWRDVSDPQIQLRIWEFSGVCTHIVTWPRFFSGLCFGGQSVKARCPLRSHPKPQFEKCAADLFSKTLKIKLSSGHTIAL